MERNFNRKLLAGLLSAGLILVTSQIYADKTLDAMNSLTPAPLAKTVTANRPLIIPSAPQIDAKAYVLMDSDSGKVIAAQNPDMRLPPASLTKLMTLYVVFDALKNGQIKMDDMVTVSQKAWQTGGSRMFIKVGTQVPVSDLLQGVIVASGNDATVALAEFVGGSEDSFTSIMNQEAQRLGLSNSHFEDSNGLPSPEHYASAKDMAILASHIINDFPEYYPLFAKKEFMFNNIKQSNRNRLLWRYEFADGLKTGHTDDAGFCLVASAKQNGMRLVSVVMGAPSDSARAVDSVNLLTYGFRFYKTYKLYAGGQSIAQARVWKGEERKVPAGVMKSLYITIPVGQYDKLAANAVLKTPINAPIAKGQQIGTLDITLDNKPFMAEPLVALKDNPKGGLWAQLSDTVSRSIHDMFHKKKTEIAAGQPAATPAVAATTPAPATITPVPANETALNQPQKANS